MPHFRKPRAGCRPCRRVSLWAQSLLPLPLLSQVPLQQSLISFANQELEKLAVESFTVVMRFMGDQSKPRNKDELDLAYELLRLCREQEGLKDEIYCQLIKQVTVNPNPESCARGWRLLSLLTGYFCPTATLMPYVTKYLQDAAQSQELARACQDHLQCTVKYGGRRRLLPVGEMKAFLKGQGVRPLVIYLPGGVTYETKIRTFSVVAEVREELCGEMGVTDPQEVQEFTICLIKSPGEPVRPLRAGTNVNSVTQEEGVTLHVRRLTWHMPLHFDNPTYISIIYSQLLRSFLQGKLLFPHVTNMEAQLAPLVAMQLLSLGVQDPSSEQDLLRHVPQVLQTQVSLAMFRPQVAQQLRKLHGLSPEQAKIHFIEAMKHMTLFGYNVYLILRLSERSLPAPCLLGFNHHHLILMDPATQKPCHSIPLKEVQRLQLLSALDSDGMPGLEVNYGSPANPKTLWLELPQAQQLRHVLAYLLEESSTQP
uniref:MyTH4 domain-containing protein n=1 Tax=Ornithorhynchus anatinus TaxID=9258 RepID=A0A6I8NVC3_ORNAN